MSQGVFIVFEGLEASGKTTQIEKLYQWVKEQNRQVVRTREPGGTPLGMELRRILLHDPNEKPAPMEELLMFLLDRQVHQRKVIRPALDRGAVVLCDRYHYSTLAYQEPGGLELSSKWQAMSWDMVGNLKPDAVILLDLPPEEGFKRLRSTSLDKIESRGLDYFQRVRGRFLTQAAEDPQRFLVLEAGRDPDQLHLMIRQRLEPLLKI